MKTAKRWLLDGAFYLAGSVLYALSVNVFSAPNQIAPGGATGVATLLNFLFDWPIGLLILLINLPLLAAAWFVLGHGFTVRTAVVTLISSAVIDATAPFLPAFTGDRILVALFGGALAGVGLALILLRGATTGGSEVVARLLERRFRHLPIGRLIFLVDTAVIAASVLVYGRLESALYAAVMVFVTTGIMDKLIYGNDAAKLFLIVTARPRAIVRGVMEQLRHGVTELTATGGFTGGGRRLLLCAVHRADVYLLRRVVQEHDPAAFTMIVTADQIVGEGFVKESDKG